MSKLLNNYILKRKKSEQFDFLKNIFLIAVFQGLKVLMFLGFLVVS